MEAKRITPELKTALAAPNARALAAFRRIAPMWAHRCAVPLAVALVPLGGETMEVGT